MNVTRKHRAPDRIRDLEAQVAAHQSAGDRLAESILRGIQDATDLHEIRQQLADAQRRIGELAEENGRLRAERVDASVLAKQLAAAEAHIRTISADNLALRAQVQNATAITVPPMVRDIDPDDQATTPTDVSGLRRSYTVKPLADALGGSAMSARKQIAIEGQQRPYPEGVWVVFMPDGFPSGVMNGSARVGDDPVKAAREFWESSAGAIKHLAEGYQIKLVSRERWRNELLPIHLGTGASDGAR